MVINEFDKQSIDLSSPHGDQLFPRPGVPLKTSKQLPPLPQG